MYLTRVMVLLCVLAAGHAYAAVREVESQATGYGPSEPEALGDALARAVTQVTGGSAQMSTGVTRSRLEASTSGTWGTQAAKVSTETTRSADFQGGGPITRYRVVSTRQLGDQRFEVKVVAVIQQYEAPSKGAARDRIAVLPVRGEPGMIEAVGTVETAEFADALGRALENRLLATGHFQVLDRASLGVSVSELTLIASDLTGAEDKARLKNLHGADYLLIPTLIVSGHGGGRINPATGQRESKPGDARIDLRVVVPATSEVVFSGQTPIRSRGYRDRDALVSAVASAAISDLDLSISGNTRLEPGVAPVDAASEGPRDERGVRLPFDP